MNLPLDKAMQQARRMFFQRYNEEYFNIILVDNKAQILHFGFIPILLADKINAEKFKEAIGDKQKMAEVVGTLAEKREEMLKKVEMEVGNYMIIEKGLNSLKEVERGEYPLGKRYCVTMTSGGGGEIRSTVEGFERPDFWHKDAQKDVQLTAENTDELKEMFINSYMTHGFSQEVASELFDTYLEVGSLPAGESRSVVIQDMKIIKDLPIFTYKPAKVKISQFFNTSRVFIDIGEFDIEKDYSA